MQETSVGKQKNKQTNKQTSKETKQTTQNKTKGNTTKRQFYLHWCGRRSPVTARALSQRGSGPHRRNLSSVSYPVCNRCSVATRGFNQMRTNKKKQKDQISLSVPKPCSSALFPGDLVIWFWKYEGEMLGKKINRRKSTLQTGARRVCSLRWIILYCKSLVLFLHGVMVSKYAFLACQQC